MVLLHKSYHEYINKSSWSLHDHPSLYIKLALFQFLQIHALENVDQCGCTKILVLISTHKWLSLAYILEFLFDDFEFLELINVDFLFEVFIKKCIIHIKLVYRPFCCAPKVKKIRTVSNLVIGENLSSKSPPAHFEYPLTTRCYLYLWISPFALSFILKKIYFDSNWFLLSR